MVLPIYVSLERLDRSFLEASRDLGAGPVATLPPDRPAAGRCPGSCRGIVLVFIPVMGEYLIPVLLGGGKTYFLGNALADLFLQSGTGPSGRRWRPCSWRGMVVVVALYLAVSSRLSGRPRGEPAVSRHVQSCCCQSMCVEPPGGPLERLGERAAWYTALVFAFLFLPIVIVVIYSFNAGPQRERSSPASRLQLVRGGLDRPVPR